VKIPSLVEAAVNSENGAEIRETSSGIGFFRSEGTRTNV